MLTLFLTAFGFGLVFNAVPGAVLVQTVRSAVAGGFRPALAVQLGSLAGDALWALLGLFGVGLLLQVDTLRLPVGLAGVALLLWLAWDSWRNSNLNTFAMPPRAEQMNPGAMAARIAGHKARMEGHKPRMEGHNESAWRYGAAISITNPSSIAYWAGIGSALGAVGIHEPKTVDYIIFFCGFMTCSLCWCFFCAAAVNQVCARLGTQWGRAIHRVCAVALVILALFSLNQLLAPAA